MNHLKLPPRDEDTPWNLHRIPQTNMKQSTPLYATSMSKTGLHQDSSWKATLYLVAESLDLKLLGEREEMHLPGEGNIFPAIPHTAAVRFGTWYRNLTAYYFVIVIRFMATYQVKRLGLARVWVWPGVVSRFQFTKYSWRHSSVSHCIQRIEPFFYWSTVWLLNWLEPFRLSPQAEHPPLNRGKISNHPISKNKVK